MLKAWQISDFKSVYGDLTIDLAPLTILVGANSSGKSSILQSILLLKQTLESASSDKALLLNGPILKLGTFKDVMNIGAQKQEFSFSFQIEECEKLFPTAFNAPAQKLYRRGEIGKVEAQIKFDVPETSVNSYLELYPTLKSASIQYTRGEEDRSQAELPTLAIDNMHGITIRRNNGNSIMPPENILLRGSGQYNCELDTKLTSEILEDKPDAKILYATAANFLPYEIAIEYNSARYVLNLIDDAFVSRRASSKINPSILAKPVPEALLLEAERIFSDILSDEKKSLLRNKPISLKDLISLVQEIRDDPYWISKALKSRNKGFFTEHYTPVTSSSLSLLNSELRPLTDELREKAAEALKKEYFTGDERETAITRPNDNIFFTLHEFFVHRIRYLGPIRDEPRPSYSSEALSKPDELGNKGERTSAVFELQKNRKIPYIPSSAFTDTSFSPTEKRVRLEEAVTDWLSYLGVTNEIIVHDKGKYGHELQVRVPGVSKAHDLTNVGVGVSQVLPVVVMALLAQPHSVLVFEQPELHLHPKVQSRLADFFLSLMFHNKQCIIETHSEYLIHRLRRRIAEASSEANLSKLVGVYFVERNAREGTKARKIEFTEYGSIVDWPEDFMDQTQLEIDRILDAASRKYNKE